MKKMLIVEDKPDVRRLLELVFRPEGYHLWAVENGEDAVAKARQIRPDVILLDVMLPGELDGYDVARILKNDSATSSCVIIIMTAKVQEGDRIQALRSGADDYIGKPFQLEDIKRKVAGSLNRA